MELVEVRLRYVGPIETFSTDGLQVGYGDWVIVEQERGIDYGKVVGRPYSVDEGSLEDEPKKIIRIATEEDMAKIQDNRSQEKDAYRICLQKIAEHNLPMKLVGAEYTFDKTKIMFYFTADGRVDFRQLVRDLAKVFRIRIEMRQIGVRDEAKMLGGLGCCGMPLCCKAFLREFAPVTIKMARQQRLTVNPSKISGVCGRLMCCLVFENEMYEELARFLPQEGEMVNTPEGEGEVVDLRILRGEVVVKVEDGREIVFPRDELATFNPEKDWVRKEEENDSCFDSQSDDREDNKGQRVGERVI